MVVARIMLTGALLALIVLLEACGATEQPEATAPADGTLPPVAAAAAQEALAERLGVSTEEIAVVSFETVEWPDACLGITGVDEACAQVMTPGWRVVLSADGEQYIYRTDYDGTVVRLEEGPGG